MNKTGQEGGGGAAALVALIALFMVLYILFLPPEERSKILGEEPSLSEGEDAVKTELLLTQPGRVVPKGDITSYHPLPSVFLSTITDAVLLETWNTAHIRRSVFTQSPQELSFSLRDPKLIDNALLNFLVVSGSGILTITLNGEQIFNREIHTRNIDPIPIKKSLLRKENVLSFSLSSPAPAFWRMYSYTLADISLRGDVLDLSKQTAQTSFYIDENEKKLLQRSSLSFTALCDLSTAEKVSLLLNGKTLFEGVPQCNVATRLDVPLDATTKGSNMLTWQSTQGNYKFDVVRFESSLKEPQNYRIYFSTTPAQYEFAREHNYPFVLSLLFTGDYIRRGRLFVNNFVLPLDIGAMTYEADISEFIRKGYNSIEIDPETAFDIQEMKVVILEKP